ncbi:MAG: quinone-interacting membrane-bound oxidoreductase complex subunit QmoC [Desulfobacteraceae bacterium]|jgi:quinone-modifying oxidoreductase, subunit QmoC|nr:quinone-interacting membrane-bound oxidoreductase complex subunit QmoC [Desulfobacteraceae bacterium]MDH3836459.1 quinone-interacting membrane-bound oxidoreductase complex subunit QmoC [Desulfobacteraceae bacterium]MDH3881761.1 quinone-interacting membrane-bound oxidoreductase complex subunit QmoC [Desulfobacteraceae bacterium]
MTDKYLIEPDVGFIKEVIGLGGDTLKKCFQCATCSVACPISPDTKPFPRKEMIAASWGLKDRLVGNLDIWLCHHCGDCTTMCPRGAKPGEVLSAVRSYAIADYAVPKSVGKAVNDPKKLPILMGIPVVIFIVLGLVTGLLDFSPPLGEHGIAHHLFFSTWLVDMIFVPLAIWVVVIFALGLKRFIADIHENAVLEGKTEKKEFEIFGFIKAIPSILPSILKHDKFSECSENKDRATAHLMVFWSFVGLFIVTNIFFVVLYVFQQHGPYSQLNPVKWLANVAGVALIIGSALMIKNRLAKKDQTSTYKDWYLLGLVFGLGVTGVLTEATRLAGMAGATYVVYFIHLVFVFNLFAFLPFSKLAHLVYRTVAIAYNEYSGRQ